MLVITIVSSLLTEVPKNEKEGEARRRRGDTDEIRVESDG